MDQWSARELTALREALIDVIGIIHRIAPDRTRELLERTLAQARGEDPTMDAEDLETARRLAGLYSDALRTP